MIIGVSVISCCLIFSIMVLILYFSKQRIDNMENKIYSILVIINVIGLILELLCCYFTYKNGTTYFNNFMCILCNRLFIIYMLTWLSLFTFYIFYITFSQYDKIKKELKKYQKKFTLWAMVIYFIFLVLAIILPINYFNDGTYVYSYGPATNLLVVFGGLTIIFDIICLITNRKHIKNKQYAPLFILIFLLICVLIIRNINPGVILINSTFAFITVLMFHTIENPDMQMISELYKNKRLIEKSNEDVSRFSFRMTQDIKKPVKDIINISKDITTMNNINEIKDANKYISNYANQVDYLINKALNISNMDTQAIKIYTTKYNTTNLFKELTVKAKEKIKNNIKFDVNISSNIPEYLYGDSIKLKQIISSILTLSNKNTEEGFISLDISSIIKYNLCRIIITVEDTGKGMSIDKVNEILSLTSDDMQKIKITDKSDLDILSVKKLTNMIGGSFMIKSEENHGTTITIILEQKIVSTKETEIAKKLENYEQSMHNEKKVLIVCDEEKDLEQIVKQISKNDILVTTTLYGKDAIEKIRTKQTFDLIILDDELGEISALTVLREFNKNKNFKTPVVVMINDNKEKNKTRISKRRFRRHNKQIKINK